MSRHQSQPLSPDVIRLKELVAAFPSSRPFDQLEVIATLGVGGFGRVELVRPRLHSIKPHPPKHPVTCDSGNWQIHSEPMEKVLHPVL